MKKSLFRTSLVIALILALVGLTVSSFAYWDRLTTRDENNVIELGEGTALQVTEKVVVDSDKNLIPSTAVLGVNDTYSVEYTFTVKLSKEAVEDLLLTVEAINVKIGGDATHAELVKITLNYDTNVNIGGTTVVVTVTLDEPTTQAAYEAIFGKTITFDLVFRAEANK